MSKSKRVKARQWARRNTKILFFDMYVVVMTWAPVAARLSMQYLSTTGIQTNQPRKTHNRDIFSRRSDAILVKTDVSGSISSIALHLLSSK